MSKTVDKPVSSENMPYTDEGPPKMSVSLPSMGDVKTRAEDTSYAPLPVDIVLLTVSNCEFLACYMHLINPFKCWFDDIGYVYFQGLGEDANAKLKVALIRCCEGSSGPGGTLVAVKNSVNILRPKAVISVGACSSLNPNKAKLGDVVVSAKLTTYTSKVVTQNQIIWAGMRSFVSKRFLNVIKHTAEGYNAPLQSSKSPEIKVHCDGEFLSGPEQVRADFRRNQLAESHSQALALEMGGEGLFTAAFDDQIEWLIVKGIADYADGDESTTENWSPFASVMAASVVAHILRDPNVFHTWPHYQSEEASSDCRGSTKKERGKKRKRTDQHTDAGLSSSHTKSLIKAKRGGSSSTTQAPRRTEGGTMIEDDAEASSDCRGSTKKERGKKRKRTDQHPDAGLSSSHTQSLLKAKSGRSSSTTQAPGRTEGGTMIEDDAEASSYCRGSTKKKGERKRKQTDQHTDFNNSKESKIFIYYPSCRTGRRLPLRFGKGKAKYPVVINGASRISNFTQRIRQFYQRREAKVLPVPWH